jgi:RNA polymerase sigma-70 factor, ECF subfamily
MDAAALNWDHRMRMNSDHVPDGFDADAQLMLRFKNGDAEAFEQLFSRHTSAMVNFVYRFVRDRQLAEELAQEIFLRVYEGAARYRASARFTTWLYKIATNVCLNEIRKPRFRAVHQSLPEGRSPELHIPYDRFDRNNAPEKLLERQAIARAIRDALSRLPDKQRTAFILNKYQELSYVEVADVMNTSEKAVKSLIHRAKEALAESLKTLLPELLHI